MWGFMVYVCASLNVPVILPLGKNSSGIQSRSRHFGEEKKASSLTETGTLYRPVTPMRLLRIKHFITQLMHNIQFVDTIKIIKYLNVLQHVSDHRGSIIREPCTVLR